MALERDMTAPAASGAESPPSRRIYSVPRRYDPATLFVVSLAYALLFGFMRSVGFPPIAFAVVAGFVTLVGLSQAILFGGKAPRQASAVAGIGAFLVVQVPVLAECALRHLQDLGILVACLPLTAILPGAMLGYVVGVLIGGVFLVAEAVRRGVRACVLHRAGHAGDGGRPEG